MILVLLSLNNDQYSNFNHQLMLLFHLKFVLYEVTLIF